MKTKVRCSDRVVFEIDPVTLEAKTCSYYDAYCYSDPERDVEYMEYATWCLKKMDLTFSKYRV